MKQGNYWLFLDDERFPVEKEGINWIIARTFDEAVEIIQTNGLPSHFQLDHDLGEGKTGYDFIKYLVEIDIEEDFITPQFSYAIHSQNPVGRKNIDDYIKNYIHFKFNN